MYLLIGENKRTLERKVIEKYENLATCLKEITKLNILHGETTRFLWRTTAEAKI